MSETPPTAPTAFVPLAADCSECDEPLAQRYFTISNKAVCTACAAEIRQRWIAGNPLTRMGGALLGGIIGGAIGAFILDHLKIRLAVILVGLLVGTGVQIGCRYRGG